MTDLLTKLSSSIYAKIRTAYSSQLSRAAGDNGITHVSPPAGAISPAGLEGIMMVPGLAQGPSCENRSSLPMQDIVKVRETGRDMAVQSLVLQVSENYPNVDPNLIQCLVDDIWAYGHVLPSDNAGRVVTIDFDGTLAEPADFPAVGSPLPGAVESVQQLISEGWKVVIHSHRASLPGGREQIASWLSREGLAVGAILPKPYSRWHISNQAIAFDGDWDSVCKRLHYDIPTSIPGPRITAASVRNGDYTLKAIAKQLGYAADEFVSDIKELYAPKSVSGIPVLESKLASKYGLKVSVAAMSSSKDTTQYVLDRVAELVEKVELNILSAGDPVLIMESGPNFGNTGTVMSVDSSSATVALDGVANATIRVASPRANLKLVAGSARYGSLALGTSAKTLILPNKYYPNGVKFANSTEWYNTVADHMFRKSYGCVASLTYAGIGHGDIRHLSASFNPEEANLTKLKSVHLSIPENSRYAAIEVRPVDGTREETCKVVVHDLVHSFIESPYLRDASLRFSGDHGYHVILSYGDELNRETINSMVDDTISGYLEYAHLDKVTTAATAEPGAIVIRRVDSDIPAAYSLHPKTGLACLPLSLDTLTGFSPEQANILKLLKQR